MIIKNIIFNITMKQYIFGLVQKLKVILIILIGNNLLQS